MTVTKGKTTYNALGFTTSHYWKNRFVGTSSFKMEDHFGWTTNSDGSVTISKDRVAFNKYGLGRGMQETLTNCYASAKKFGLGAVIEMFTDRLDQLYLGVAHATKAPKRSAEKELNVEDETLKGVVFMSLISDYKVSKKEAAVLMQNIAVAAAQMAERHNKPVSEILEEWTKTAEAEDAEFAVEEDDFDDSDDHASA